MKVSVEDVSSVKKTLRIEVPEDQVTSELNDAYKNLKKNAKVKGFRPGKAPRGVLERMYGKDVNADVSGKLIQQAMIEAIQETELKILGSPEVDPPELKAGEAYRFDAAVEISPDIESIDFKGLSLTKKRYVATDEEIATQLKMLQKNLTKTEKIAEERAVQQGDFVLIDYEGFKDGNPFGETQKTENMTMKIGDAHISADFDDALVGMQPEESKTFEIGFPEDYFNKALAGQTIEFQVTLNEIRQENVPEIDDAMAKQLGQFETLDDVKAEIRKNLQQGYDKRSEQELNEQIFSSLIAKTDFEIPEIMVKYELESIVADAEKSFSYHNVSMEDVGVTREGLEEKYRETAEKQVRRHLILTQIIEQESLELTDDEIKAGYQEMADNYNHPVEEIKNFYEQNKDKLDIFKHTLLEKHAIKLILDNSSVEEVEAELENSQDSHSTE